ncbi:hypothetical protein R3P38DRAFT_139879, partial [Favolaschia claudopus]
MSSLSNDLCTKCHIGFFTLPRACEGFHTPGANEGRSYQRCQYNNFKKGAENPCTGYRWRDDIPRQMLPLNSSPSDSDSPATSTPILIPITQLTPPSIPFVHNTISPSKSTRRAAKQPCVSISCTQLGHRGGHRHAKCLWQFCKGCCQQTQEHCPAPRHNDPPSSALNSFTAVSPRSDNSTSVSTPTASLSSQNSLPITFAKPMGRMVDAAYAQKILQGDHDVAVTNNFQREIYRKSEILSLKIRIWTTNGQAPYSLVVSNPTAPWFHPKDCEPITTLIGQKACVTYAYWERSEWILTNVAIKVKPSVDTLLLRLADVSDCVDGPRSKRRLSESSSHYQTPSPIRARTSRERPHIEPLSYTQNSSPSPMAQGPSVVIDLSSGSEDELPDPDVPLGSKISVTTQQPTLGSTQAQTVSTASTAVFTPKFPLEYACEMDVAFKTMASQSGTVANRFRNTFHLPFVRTTYYTHYNAWREMEADALAYAVQCGRNAGGNWQ